MKNLLAALLCLVLLSAAAGLFPAAVSAAEPMIVWNFDTPNSARAVIGNDRLLAGVAVTHFQVGDGGGTGIVAFDEKEQALCFRPDYTKPATSNLHYQRVTISVTDEAMGFKGTDYPYIKVKFKLESSNDMTTLRIRSFDWSTWDIYSIPELGTWIECTYDLTGTSFEDQVFNPQRGIYFQMQSMNSGYNTYTDTDYKLYIQYIAFFRDKSDCRAYTYTPTDPATLPGAERSEVGGKIALLPFDEPQYIHGLWTLGENPPAESQFTLMKCEFGADNNGYYGYDAEEGALYIASAVQNVAGTTHSRFNILGSGGASVSGADYPYVQFAYKTENYTPSDRAFIRIRDNAWNSVTLVPAGQVKAGEWTVVSLKLDDAPGGEGWRGMIFDATHHLRLQLDDAGTNPTAHRDARIYLKYIAFFERKADMDAFDFAQYIAATPDAREAPVTTAAPAATAAPQTTAVPETTAVPKTTTAPETTNEPEMTTVPAVTSSPAAEEEPPTLSFAEFAAVAVLMLVTCCAAAISRKKTKK